MFGKQKVTPLWLVSPDPNNGSDPLFQPKCRLEKTDFVKLLCRKDKPYDPGKRRTLCMNLLRGMGRPIYVDDEAVDVARKLTDNKVKIGHINMEDQQSFYEGMLFNPGNDTDEIERVVGQLVQGKG